jgi:hypothetical protein
MLPWRWTTAPTLPTLPTPESWPIDWVSLRQGLDEFGGFCDCEVVMNCDSDALFG